MDELQKYEQEIHELLNTAFSAVYDVTLMLDSEDNPGLTCHPQDREDLDNALGILESFLVYPREDD